MATLSDVAGLAGVSTSTASRALSRPELVAPATRVRVQQAARSLDFVLNRAASGLAKGRTGLVAVVVPNLENQFFTPIVVGAQRWAEGHQLQVTIAANPLLDARQVTAFGRLARQVDGVIVAAPLGSDRLVREACRMRPAVLVDRQIGGVSSVIADTAAAFGILADHLIGRGHGHLVHLGGPRGSWQHRQRIRELRARTAGRAELTVLGPFPPTFAAGAAAAGRVLSSGATAAIPYATQLGLGLGVALRRTGAATDLLVTTESLVAEAIGDRATPTLDVDGPGLGAAAMELLVARVNGDRTAAEQVRLPVRVTLPADA